MVNILNFLNQIKQAYFQAFKKSLSFKSVSTRQEYWGFILGSLVVNVLIIIICQLFDISGTVDALFPLITLIPLVSITIRRLRDIGRSWQWVFVILIPLFPPLTGFLILQYAFLSPTNVDGVTSNDIFCKISKIPQYCKSIYKSFTKSIEKVMTDSILQEIKICINCGAPIWTKSMPTDPCYNCKESVTKKKLKPVD